jgi:ComF family protein
MQNLPFHMGRICYSCGDTVFGSGSYCLHCKDHEKPYEFARAPFTYEKAIKTLIYQLKYSKGKYLAPYLSLFLVDEFVKQNWNVDVIIPVPLFIGREKKRGFNQAALLSSQFEKLLSLPIDKESLIRVKNTPTQTKLTKVERKNNLTKAFVVTNKLNMKNKSILLIDDVFTTGATIEECSIVLKKAGAKNVYAITLAHVKQNLPMY